MIPYIDSQLAIWGKWSMARASSGIGYSPVCPMFKDVRHGGAFGSTPPMGVTVDGIQNIHDMDAAVQRLEQGQRQLAIEFYVLQRRAVDIAQGLGIARQRLYDRLHALHQAVLGHLNDVAADS